MHPFVIYPWSGLASTRFYCPSSVDLRLHLFVLPSSIPGKGQPPNSPSVLIDWVSSSSSSSSSRQPLVRVSLHTFLSSASVIHPLPFDSSSPSFHRFVFFGVLSITYFTAFLRIRVVIIYKIVEPRCTAFHAKPKAAKGH